MTSVKEGDWVLIGEKNAVIRSVSETSIQAIYLDHRNQAISEEIQYVGEKWKFKYEGPCGSYADHIPELGYLVTKLRKGRIF